MLTLKAGDRFKFKAPFMSWNDFGSGCGPFPGFTVPEGTTGVVESAGDDTFADCTTYILKFDQHFEFLEEWENVLQVLHFKNEDGEMLKLEKAIVLVS